MEFVISGSNDDAIRRNISRSPQTAVFSVKALRFHFHHPKTIIIAYICPLPGLRCNTVMSRKPVGQAQTGPGLVCTSDRNNKQAARGIKIAICKSTKN